MPQSGWPTYRSAVLCAESVGRDDHAVAITDRDAQVRYRGVAEHSARA